jgi:hypothetical protein
MTSWGPPPSVYPHFHVLTKVGGDPIDCTWDVLNQGSEDVEVRLRINVDGGTLIAAPWALLVAGSNVTTFAASATLPLVTLPGVHAGRLRCEARRLGPDSRQTLVGYHDFTVNVP